VWGYPTSPFFLRSYIKNYKTEKKQKPKEITHLPLTPMIGFFARPPSPLPVGRVPEGVEGRRRIEPVEMVRAFYRDVINFA
jgi:hypothetical protein